MEDSDDGPSLPTKQNEEFRPFIRRLPEFKFWHAATKGILHMIKYRYIPFTHGKRRYKGKEDVGKTFAS
ncbi:UNVERIFIED_CONTAM: Protein RER1, partial [Eudyptes pachyrhynchus]